MMAAMRDHGPVCPSCGSEIDPSGPGVSSHPAKDDSAAPSSGFWVPFVEDLRGTPTRLIHADCYAGENGLPALIAVIHEHDRGVRHREYERWRRSHTSQQQ
jgi:hypothetical protein